MEKVTIKNRKNQNIVLILEKAQDQKDLFGEKAKKRKQKRYETEEPTTQTRLVEIKIEK